MLYGALIPERLGERFSDDGTSKYEAITHVYYFGDWAFVTGLTDTLRRSLVNELITKLHVNGVRKLHYYSKSDLVVWRLYSTERGSVRAELL